MWVRTAACVLNMERLVLRLEHLAGEAIRWKPKVHAARGGGGVTYMMKLVWMKEFGNTRKKDVVG